MYQITGYIFLLYVKNVKQNKEMRDRVYQATFGHLAPKKNTTYRGKIKVAEVPYGNVGTAILDIAMKNLSDSPWLYDAIEDFLWEMRDNFESGGVYSMKITFRNYRIWATGLTKYQI